jgi:hypothetical protein
MEKKTKNNYRKRYEKLIDESEGELDKYIRFLAGGALVLSLTFIGDLLPNNDTEYLYIITGGWILLIVSLFLNFISYYITIWSTNKSINEIDNDDKNWIEKTLKRNCHISWLGYLSAACLFLGILMLVLFVILNLNNYGN